MVEIIHNIFDDDFDKNLSHTLNLSVLIGVDRCAYTIVNQQNQLLGLRVYQIDELSSLSLKKIFTEDTIIRDKYKKTTLGVFSKDITFIPTQLYDENHNADYLNLTNDIQPNDFILSRKLSFIDAHALSAFSDSVFRQLANQFKDAQLCHVSVALIEYYNKYKAVSGAENIFVHILGRHLLCTVFAEGKFVFHNIFNFKNANDALYFVMALYKKFEFNPEKTPLNLSGDITEDAEIYKLLYKYIQSLYLSERPAYYHYNKALTDKINANFFLDLYSLKLCEL